ncbi:MAG: HdeD family acid-resistance protein [Acutalibacteraceae bacterium]
MEKLRKQMPKKVINIIFSVVIALLGVVLLIFPDATLYSTCYITGALTLIWGIKKAVQYIGDRKYGIPNILDLISGIALIIIAVTLLVHPAFLVSVIPFLLGISIVVFGISSLLSPSGILGKILNICITVFGFSVMFNPFNSAVSLARMLGIAFLIYGIIKVIAEIMYGDKNTYPPSDNGDGYTEVEFRDVE